MATAGDSPPNDGVSSTERDARMKDRARESRLSFRNIAEQSLRRELKEDAIAICKPEIGTFAECAQANGLWVVWTCRDLYKEVNACMQKHNGEEAWQKYKAAHEQEIQRRSKVG